MDLFGALYVALLVRARQRHSNRLNFACGTLACDPSLGRGGGGKSTHVCSFVLEEPALRWLVIALKFGPWREELLKQWRELRSRGVKRDRSTMLASALTSTFCAMRKHQCPAWTLNVGHQQCHVSGPMALFQRLGLAKSAKAHQPGALHTAYGKWKRLLPSAGKVQLEKWIAMADEVGELGSPPRTCREWIDLHVKVHDIVVKHKVRGLRGRCSWKKTSLVAGRTVPGSSRGREGGGGGGGGGGWKTFCYVGSQGRVDFNLP